MMNFCFLLFCIIFVAVIGIKVYHAQMKLIFGMIETIKQIKSQQAKIDD